VVLSRYDEVREVLVRDADFPVAFDAAFRELDPDHKIFVLGMGDDAAYGFVRRATMNAFRWTDAARVGALAYDHAETALQNGRGRVDAMQDLMIGSLREIVGTYFGVPASADFVLWMFATALYDFAPRTPQALRDQAAIAAGKIADTVLAAIAEARANPSDTTAVGRFVTMRPDDAPLDDVSIRVMMTGMITGSLPTNTLATANILDVLLDNPDIMAAAEAAAKAGDDDLLGRCLLEASRFRPINFGPFRRAESDTVIADGTSRAVRIRKDDLILAGTWMAMLDPRRIPDPLRFDPTRPATQYLGFGHGQHWCLGAHLAIAHMTQVFKPLLRRGGVRRAPGPDGRATCFGPFAEHLTVLYND
jgi:cytochrome P450